MAKQFEMMDERRVTLERARLAEEAGRWDDMVDFMNSLVKEGRDLSVEERNLLANAYKNHVGAKRAAWRILMGIEQGLEGINRKRELSKEYRIKIEDELKLSCNELLGLIDKHLINTIDMENEIFYLKMKGDYYRYLAEFCRDNTTDYVFDSAKIAYAQALELSRENLSAAHPLRLGLILNFSVFYYEILETHEVACEMVKDSVSAGENDLHNQTESARNDSVMILKLLKDNLKIWSAEIDSQAVSKQTHKKYY